MPPPPSSLAARARALARTGLGRFQLLLLLRQRNIRDLLFVAQLLNGLLVLGRVGRVLLSCGLHLRAKVLALVVHLGREALNRWTPPARPTIGALRTDADVRFLQHARASVGARGRAAYRCGVPPRGPPDWSGSPTAEIRNSGRTPAGKRTPSSVAVAAFRAP